MIVKNNKGFAGLFATRSFKAGDTVRKLSGEVRNKPTRTSIEIGENQHIEDELGSFVNHSCTPNTIVQEGEIKAISNIVTDEEITFDYNLTESSMSDPFICNCCGHLVAGRLHKKVEVEEEASLDA